MTEYFEVESGEEIIRVTRRPPDDTWITAPQAAALLCMSRGTFYTTLTAENEFMGVDQMLRGTRGNDCAKGQGRLWYKPDLDLVMKLKRNIGVSTQMALRVFRAHQTGKIHIADFGGYE